MHWTIPKLWSNQTVFIIGGGPSAADLDFGRLHGRNVIALNSAFEDGDWPICYFQDFCWWEDNHEALEGFDGLKVTICSQLVDRPDVMVLKRGARHGFSLDEAEVSYGTNTGYGAINLAVKLGGSRIVLFGYDMRRVEGRDNYHDRHSRIIEEKNYEDNFIRSFGFAVETLDRLGIEVINATPNSALRHFPIVSMEEGLCY